MQMMNCDQIKKSCEGLLTRFTNIFTKGKKRKKDVQVEHSSDEIDDEQEFDEEEYNKEDVHPNNTGQKPKTKSFKRSVLAGGVVAVTLGLFLAKYWQDENTSVTKPPTIQSVSTQEPADIKTVSKEQTGKGELTYATEINRQKYLAEQKVKNQQMKVPQTAPQKSPEDKTLFNVPPPNSNLFGAAPAAVRPETAEERALREENERYRAPISFQIAGSPVQKANNTQQAITVANNANSIGSSGNTASPAGNQNAGISYIAPSAACLMPGTTIPAMLYSGINTDTPGQITAIIQADVYDTATQSAVLIPAGSQLIGKFENSNTANGRVNLTFSTIIMPDGGAYIVGDAMIAVDKKGYGGVAGKVNRHTGRAVSGGILTSAMAALGSMAAGNTNNDSNTYSAGQLAMQGAMANMINTSSKLFEKGMNVNATTVVEPGYEFNVYITQPIIFNKGR